MPVNFSTTKGQATQAYEINRSKDVVTVTAVDLTSIAGITSLTNGLKSGARIKLSAVPNSDGTLKAFSMSYFTGDQPQASSSK